MDTQIDRRFKQAWQFFSSNAANLLLGSLIVLAGSVLVLPAPWFTLNLLSEVIDCQRTGRPVRWQAAFDRPGLLLPSLALGLVLGSAISFGLLMCLVPGTLLAIAWLHAPALVADGRPVLEALGESYQLLRRNGGWTASTLNALVLLALVGLSLVTGVVTLVTLPLALCYLAAGYLEDAQPGLRLPPAVSDLSTPVRA